VALPPCGRRPTPTARSRATRVPASPRPSATAAGGKRRSPPRRGRRGARAAAARGTRRSTASSSEARMSERNSTDTDAIERALGLVIVVLIAYRLAYHASYLGEVPFAHATFS